MTALKLIVLLCTYSGQDYHLCHESLIQCTKHVHYGYGIELHDAVLWCHEKGSELDRKFSNQGEGLGR